MAATAHGGEQQHDVLGAPGNVARMVDRLSRVDIGSRLVAHEMPRKTMASSSGRAHVLYEYTATQDDELDLAVGEIIELLEEKEIEDGWMRGRLANGRVGVFPSNFVEIKRTPSTSPPPPKPSYPANVKAEPPPVPKPPVPHQEQPSPTDVLPDAIQRRPTSGSVGSIGDKDTGAKAPLTTAGQVKAATSRFNQPSVVPSSVQPPKKEQKFKEMARVMFTYEPKHNDELELPEVGVLVTITKKDTGDPGWFEGELNGKRGLFPDNFVEVIQVPIESTSGDSYHRAPTEKPPLERPTGGQARAHSVIQPPLLPVKPPKPALNTNGNNSNTTSAPSALGQSGTTASPQPLPGLVGRKPNPAFDQLRQNMAGDPRQVEFERKNRNANEPLGPMVDKNDNEKSAEAPAAVSDTTASSTDATSGLVHINKGRAPRPQGVRPKSMFPRTNNGSTENLLDTGDSSPVPSSNPMTTSLHAKSLSGSGLTQVGGGGPASCAAATVITKPSVIPTTTTLTKEKDLPSTNVSSAPIRPPAPQNTAVTSSQSSSVDSPWVSRREFGEVLSRLEALENENAELRKRIAKLEGKR